MRNLKEALNHGLILKKNSLSDWLRPYITKLRQKETKQFWERFFQVNVSKYRDIKLETTEMRRNYLVSELNCHTTNLFTENLLAIEMKKRE